MSETINSQVEIGKAKYNDFAILYRANYNSRSVEQGFMKANIPYTMYSGFKFFQRAEIKDCIAYLKMIVYADDLSLLRTINNPKRSFGKTKLKFLKEKSEAESLSYYETLLKYQEEVSFTKTKVKQFIDTIDKYKKTYKTLTISELLRELLDKSGYDEELCLSGDQERIDNVSELLSSIVNMEEEYGEKLELDDYLQQIALFSDNDREANKNSVKLMTIHTAKGLEFPYVFLVSFNDGILPSYRSLDKGNKIGLEEERRLAYVAITRAMKGFYMTESEGFTNYGKRKVPSRFIFEIKQTLFTRVGVLEQELIEEAMESFKDTEQKNEIKSTSIFQLNDSISHPVFGKGTVKEINTKENQYLIHFIDKDITRPISISFKGLDKDIKY
ncbi:ATP-dependent helicase [Sporosarcina koreensis]|uniref:ATP-dependent helicase n=1 Tax=Sporosarcina koreensis TaxID=334735 RepID=A0ABW0TXM5_9BACL